jgi:formate dehydrogenase iron-sulfur subunit
MPARHLSDDKLEEPTATAPDSRASARSDAPSSHSSTETPVDPIKTFVDALLAEQRELTAVERFAFQHRSGEIPSQARYYRNLIPLSKPGAGEQYAFEVNLDQCSGCKACVAACHSLNGLEDEESWRSVGLLVGEFADKPTSKGAGEQGSWREKAEGIPIPLHRSPAPLPQGSPTSIQRTVTTACHHCADPGCLNGCPVLAYEKDPITGIVRHLDDQCIGCQYCVMKCPYEVPKFSKRLGIVRKCDMCSQRLAVGEAPACVQSCPNEAIRIAVVDVAEVSLQFRSAVGSNCEETTDAANSINSFLPASPRPGITVPTTRYVSSILDTSNLHAADEAFLHPADPHLPLVAMLPLSQLSVGLMTGLALSGSIAALKFGVTTAFIAMSIALGVATLHLGQPLRAWKAFLGWRKSWFSREVIAFGQYHGFLGLFTTVLWLKPELLNFELPPVAPGLGQPAAALGALLGLGSVFCSVMLYADTQREFWSFGRTFGKFFGSAAILGLAGSGALLDSSACWGATIAVFVAKLAIDLEILRFLKVPGYSSLQKSALLITRRFSGTALARVAFGICGGVLLPASLLAEQPAFGPATGLVAVLLLLAGEMFERFLFFTAVAPTKMPGGISA